ncbi:MAG: SEC-C metal-binding domain-containing protein [Gammaproteobacteria bacterium]|nr:SEC-C metal-binding domain-containing protein [Gammaproteobacteria bacterium]
MITDEDVIELFRKCQAAQPKQMDRNRGYYQQFRRGTPSNRWKNHHPGGCDRDKVVFDQFNVIPKYCFDCYKVQIEPRTVMELFKLMMVFEQIKLPLDNGRKCLTELRTKVSGTYKGLIYCQGFEEAEKMLTMIREIISEEISKEIKISLKRGCSEYAIAYPKYELGKGKKLMPYNESWQKYEDIVDSSFVVDKLLIENETLNHPTYTSEETDTMLFWLTYAASIGDMSYLPIYGLVLAPFEGWTRTTSFNSDKPDKNKDTTSLKRNDPCFCGSGKKYKRCCFNLKKESLTDQV